MSSVAADLNLAALISGACRNAENLPGALIACGVVEAAAALCLIIFKEPGGMFLHHGKAPFFLYYGILAAVVVFGLFEASAGFWVSGNVTGRLALGRTVLWVSILPLVMVSALGGFAMLNLK
ncbi:uncharacterized protein LOC112269514 [Brachypodium distachyon]|uniref:Uncharacterized protein n=1 Tax=Brachypodium distachyon TaxID=15368 RepID=A0A0Q3KWZ1_BRADI|nr:uncharacterized protein LOC112269514 [Brachypodium distachyon]KQJ84677.1 hypothetical protein BRADI_5g22183v3 [Brachypodium distachyon]|eukprot:XP_024312136.1 uncharacterized protein LOC112269514 [Brachypodium distachyon]